MSIPMKDGVIVTDTIVKFKGYDELPEGEEEILVKDELVKVIGYNDETENYLVEALDDAERVANVFEEELDEAPADEEEAPKKTTRSRSKSKAAAKPAAKETKAKDKTSKAKTKAKSGKTKAAETEAPAKEAEPAKKTTKRTAAKKSEEKAGGIVVMDSIKELVADHDTALVSAKQLADTINEDLEQLEQSKFTLGGVLSYIKAEKAYEDEGFESIEAYCEEKLALKDRSCQTYMQVYTNLTAAGVTEKEIEGVGISKLRTVASVIDKKNKRSLIAKAKKSTRDDLVAHVKEVRTGKVNAADPDAPKFAKVPAMSLHEDKADVVKGAFEEAMKVYEVDSMAEAMYHIAVDWMQAQEAEVPIEDALETFNNRYGTDFELEEE
jgi:hypothetical protein